MKPDNYMEISSVNLENALLDYDDYSKSITGGQYRCRVCGVLFSTLEEHDRHYRQMHGKVEAVSLAGMPL